MTKVAILLNFQDAKACIDALNYPSIIEFIEYYPDFLGIIITEKSERLTKKNIMLLS